VTVYLDTSVVLSRFLGQSNALKSWGEWDRAFTSDLTHVEFHRTLDRLRLNGSITDLERVQLSAHFRVLWQTLHRVPLAPTILARAAEPFPTVVGTLDALHLASALAAARADGDNLTVLTHDDQLGRAASAMDLSVVGL